MKILHIPHAYHPVVGGAEIYCQRVTEVLRARGYDVSVLTSDVSAVHNYYEWGLPRITPRREVVNGVPVLRLGYAGWLYRLGGRLAGFGPRWLSARLSGRLRRLLNAWFFRRLRHEIARSGADIVMTTPHLVTNVLGVLKAKETLDFELVMAPMLHEESPHWDLEGMRAALAHASAAVALTHHEADRLATAYGMTAERVYASLVGVDVAPVSDAPRQARVAFIGRKVASKGVIDLIEAMELVWRSRPEIDLVIAGVRVPETKAIDERLATLPQAQRDKVLNLDFIDDAQKAEILSTSRCLVLPSKSESFGIVILEAWAHGAVPITWDLPVFRSIVRDGQTGVLVDPVQGPRGLATAILRMVDDPHLAASLGAAGRETALRDYSWNAVADTFVQAYQGCLRRRAAA